MGKKKKTKEDKKRELKIAIRQAAKDNAIGKKEANQISKLAEQLGFGPNKAKSETKKFLDRKDNKGEDITLRGGAAENLGLTNWNNKRNETPPPESESEPPGGGGGGNNDPLITSEDEFPEPEEEGLGYDRVSEDKVDGFYIDEDTGIAYQTYKKRGQGRQILRIGNVPGTRIKGGSIQKDVKMIDYDASIENYDPSRHLSFVEKGKGGKYKLKIKEPERQNYSANNFRSKEQKKDYRERGILEKGVKSGKSGGMIKQYKDHKGDYKKIKIDKQGQLKRLTLTDSGEYKPTRNKYPSEIKGTSFEDTIETGTGLSYGKALNRDERIARIKNNTAGSSASYGSGTRSDYIKRGKAELKIDSKPNIK
tara:strand:+ start:66 stop:1160 length:1095 start_codon:yes stop_codon:yes gene_type:complete